MQQRNEYHVITNVAWTDNAQLERSDGEAIIIEHTEDGIVFFWPLFPRCYDYEELLVGSQDLEDYLIDGAWIVPDPWMYFDRLENVLALINRQQLPLQTCSLGWLHSIREARAKAIVMMSLAP